MHARLGRVNVAPRGRRAYDPAMSELPPHYAATTRTVLKYAIVMTGIALLSGISYQESAKKLPIGSLDPGLHLEATLRLALVHGHMMVTAVLVPIAMLGALFLSRAATGREVKPITTKLLVRGYLPFVTGTVILMLLKGYHFLLAVRGGNLDLADINERFLGLSPIVRHSLYGFVHAGMGLTLCMFLFGIWRALRPPAEAAS